MALSERLKLVINFLNGFRKFTIMILLMMVGIIFRLTGHLTGEEMVNLLSGTAVAFMASNSVEHMKDAVIEWIKGHSNNDNS